MGNRLSTDKLRGGVADGTSGEEAGAEKGEGGCRRGFLGMSWKSFECLGMSWNVLECL